MPDFIDDSTFGEYFENFAHTAWRLETRRGYASDREGERYQLFLAGRLPLDTTRPWCINVQKQTAQGKRFERVRVVDDPPTEEQRFLFEGAASNNQAGEDIRNMWRSDAERAGLPAEDFWLFDSRFALRMHFDAADEYLGADLVEDPAEVLRYCQIRDAAWHFAVSRDAFRAHILAG
ncbi:DUF6879 family protein [Streptomyces sulphureus]|uniref:DUF6879 family protein n=1 Tax=Streptomyces sulphureus TaxID=47758 RepID=UPI0003762FA8|nr:DUF6879 family protein [Streptomyces sulphureus]